MELRILDRRQDAQRGQHTIGARRDRLRQRTPIVYRFVDEADLVTPAREETRGGATGGPGADDQNRRQQRTLTYRQDAVLRMDYTPPDVFVAGAAGAGRPAIA